MSSWTALIVYALGIVGLFFLDRDGSVRTSKALWLPVIWLWIVGSRPVSIWLGITHFGPPYKELVDGSPFDRLIFLILMALGMLVLIHRSRRTSVLPRASWPILVYFFYCLFSILWSDFPDIAFKRWTKALGDLVMVLIVVTDADPLAALRRLFSRTGFILMPASLLVIKYFGDLGRAYDPFIGTQMNIGVAADKNMLGVTTFVLSLGALWRILTLLRDGDQLNRGRHLLAQCTLLAFGLTLLMIAHSATSVVCFALGAGLMLATGLSKSKSRPAFVHALVLGILLAGGLTISLGSEASVVHALGRQTNLTGRSAIWEAVIPMTPNPVLGAGFESFWLGSRLEAMWNAFPVFRPNEAHNGYIEVYLNLGWMGVALIALVLVNGYRHATAVFRRDSAFGALMVAYVVAAAFYSITEAGFRMLDPIWIFFLLATAASTDFASNLYDEQPETIGLRANRGAVFSAIDRSFPDIPREEN